MPAIIEWRKEPLRQHTGSAELRGLGLSSPPTMYMHPADNYEPGTTAQASSAAGWTYTQTDATVALVPSPNILVTVSGFVSYDRYRRDHTRYSRLSWWQKPWTASGVKFGQDRAKNVFGRSLATGIQPSGFLRYQAYLRINPPNPQPTPVSVTASLRSFAMGMATLHSDIGMGREATASAEVMNEQGHFHRVRNRAYLQFPFQVNGDNDLITYTVIVPPGGEVHIGTVQVGLGYEIRDGASSFHCFAEVQFTVNPQGTPDSVPGLITDGGEGISDTDEGEDEETEDEEQ